MKKPKALISATFFVLFLLANPAYFAGCTQEEETFSFGGTEMGELVDQINGSVWEIDGYELELIMDRPAYKLAEEVARFLPAKPGLLASAEACGNRSFVASAEACVTESSLHLTGVAIIHRINDDGSVEKLDELPVTGELIVGGYDLDNASVELTLPDGAMRLDWREDTSDDFQLLWLQAENVGDSQTVIDYHYNY